MAPLAIAVLSLSMSADAFAAAIGQGAARRPSVAAALRTGLVFGVIEGLTPILGWALGLAASAWVAAIDHWIAFGLLGLVGGRMIWEALFRAEHAGDARPSRRGRWAIVATAVGTSIDACVVGVTLALIGANIWVIAASIGFTTFVLATLGLLIGKTAGARLGSAVELVGGVLLIGLGVKILLEHLGVIGW
jgi:putative Mn2+ efflux pump MntP